MGEMTENLKKYRASLLDRTPYNASSHSHIPASILIEVAVTVARVSILIATGGLSGGWGIRRGFNWGEGESKGRIEAAEFDPLTTNWYYLKKNFILAG